MPTIPTKSIEERLAAAEALLEATLDRCETHGCEGIATCRVRLHAYRSTLRCCDLHAAEEAARGQHVRWDVEATLRAWLALRGDCGAAAGR